MKLLPVGHWSMWPCCKALLDTSVCHILGEWAIDKNSHGWQWHLKFSNRKWHKTSPRTASLKTSVLPEEIKIITMSLSSQGLLLLKDDEEDLYNPYPDATFICSSDAANDLRVIWSYWNSILGASYSPTERRSFMARCLWRPLQFYMYFFIEEVNDKALSGQQMKILLMQAQGGVTKWFGDVRLV